MRLIVTAMKNEGPFILEWAAFHLAIGFDRFLVYTNDCDDGTDAIWARLAALGHGAHEVNDDIRARGVQKTALMRADDHPLTAEAEWIACLDADEFVNVKVGDGSLDALFSEIPDADMIMLCWRRFGAAGIGVFRDKSTIELFQRAAPEICPYPFHNYGFKSIWRRGAGWARIGVHRPLDPDPGRLDELRVFTGGGQPAPGYRERGLWLQPRTAGYSVAQLNHYCLRSAES
ncbi:MAG: glycosyltransferase family 2 protein, partial [Pseudomonadota bacterium]